MKETLKKLESQRLNVSELFVGRSFVRSDFALVQVAHPRSSSALRTLGGRTEGKIGMAADRRLQKQRN